MDENKSKSILKSLIVRSKTTVESVKPRAEIVFDRNERNHPQEPVEVRARRLNPDAKYAFGRDKFFDNP